MAGSGILSATRVGPARGVVAQPAQRPGIAAVAVPGEQGRKGEPGTGYDHQQPSAASLWTIAHNLNARPAVQTFTVGGIEMQGAVQHLSADVLTVSFVIPIAGYARIV